MDQVKSLERTSEKLQVCLCIECYSKKYVKVGVKVAVVFLRVIVCVHI